MNHSPYHSTPRGAPTANPVFAGVATMPAGTPAAPGVAFSGSEDCGFFLPASGAVAVTTGGTERLRLSGWTMTLGGPPGGDALRVVSSATTVNRVEVTGAGVGGTPSIAARGTDANITLVLTPKGTGTVQIAGAAVIGSGLVNQFTTALTIPATQHATSRCARIAVDGWLLNQDRSGTGTRDFGVYQMEGGGGWRFEIDIDGKVRVPRALEAVPAPVGGSWLQAAGAATGGSPALRAQGGDAVVHLTLTPKGGGTIILSNLPTSPAGLPTGGLWNSGGTLKIV